MNFWCAFATAKAVEREALSQQQLGNFLRHILTEGQTNDHAVSSLVRHSAKR